MTLPNRLRPTLAALAALALALPAGALRAQEWPTRPIRWIVPYLPGTAPDMTVRAMAEALTEILKQPLVVENKAGAGGNIGAQQAARAPADGHTWVYSATPMAINMRMYRNPGFDVMADFAHVSRIVTSDVLVVVGADSGMRTLNDLLERLHKAPGKLNYGSGGVGTPAHLGAELLLNAAGAQAVHVPFKGAVESINAVAGRQIDFTLAIFQVALAQVRSGRLVALAVTGPARNPQLPGVPTLAEAGLPGVNLVSFGGVSLPAGTAPAIVRRVGDSVRQALERPAVRARLEALGSTISVGTPEQYAADIRAEIILTERMMKLAKLEAQ